MTRTKTHSSLGIADVEQNKMLKMSNSINLVFASFNIFYFSLRGLVVFNLSLCGN